MSYLNPLSAVRPCLSGAVSAVTYVVSATVQKTAAAAATVFSTIGNVASRAIFGAGPALKGLVQSYGTFYAKSPLMAVVSGAAMATTVAYVAYQRFAIGTPPAADAAAEETSATDAVGATTKETPPADATVAVAATTEETPPANTSAA